MPTSFPAWAIAATVFSARNKEYMKPSRPLFCGLLGFFFSKKEDEARAESPEYVPAGFGAALAFCTLPRGHLFGIRSAVCSDSSLVVGNILCNVLQGTIQCFAQLAERFGFGIVICPQASNGLAVDSGVLAQKIGGNPFLTHCFPKSVKAYHIAYPHLDI